MSPALSALPGVSPIVQHLAGLCRKHSNLLAEERLGKEAEVAEPDRSGCPRDWFLVDLGLIGSLSGALRGL